MVCKTRYPFIDVPPSKTRIQYINANPDAYLKDLIPNEVFQWEVPINGGETFSLSHSACVLARDLTDRDLKECLNLIEDSSSADYKASSVGWSRAKKIKEMRLPDLRYVLLRQSRDGVPQGFMSFMLTYEDGFEVIYLYEIHLRPALQDLGLGKKMMDIFEGGGRTAEVKKAMLTVFKANQKALRFYEKLGYEEDDFSPRPRKLRDGIVKEPEYIILSKEISKEYDDAEVRRLSKLARRNHFNGLPTRPSKKRKAR